MAGWYFALKFIHIVSSAVLFGTGLGIAFFLWMAHRTGDARTIAATARSVVIADAVFTASAVVVQLLTGAALASIAGVPLGLYLADPEMLGWHGAFAALAGQGKLNARNFAQSVLVPRSADLMDFAFSYITRSGRIDDARLRAMSPRFMARYEAEKRMEARHGT